MSLNPTPASASNDLLAPSLDTIEPIPTSQTKATGDATGTKTPGARRKIIFGTNTRGGESPSIPLRSTSPTPTPTPTPTAAATDTEQAHVVTLPPASDLTNVISNALVVTQPRPVVPMRIEPITSIPLDTFNNIKQSQSLNDNDRDAKTAKQEKKKAKAKAAKGPGWLKRKWISCRNCCEDCCHDAECNCQVGFGADF